MGRQHNFDKSEPVLPGIKPVLELLQSEPARISKIYCRGDIRGAAQVLAIAHKNAVPVEKVDGVFLDKMCAASGRQVAHQGVIAILSQASLRSVDELFAAAPNAPLPVVVALDQVKDPGNVGAICRTAYALGCAGLLLPKHNGAALGAAAYRTSAGALGKMPCAIATNLGHALDRAEELDFFIYGAACATSGEKGIAKFANVFSQEWQFPAIIVLGSEEKGIRESIAKRCGLLITIPLARNFDSLNVAQAGAIIMGFLAAQFNQCQ